MILLAGGKEEEKTSVSPSTGRPSIIQPPPITVTFCQVIGKTINDNLERRRATILSSREEEQMKRWRPHGIEPHQIARSASTKENTVERRDSIVREDKKQNMKYCE